MKHFVLTFALFLFAADPVAAQSLHPPPVQAIAAQLTPAAVDLTPQQSAVIREQAPIHLSLNDDRWETRDHRRGAANGALVGVGISAIAISARVPSLTIRVRAGIASDSATNKPL